MAFSFVCLTLQRVVLPVILVIGALYRPVGISFVYLLMFFVSPFVPLATDKSSRSSFSAYFIILITLSTILILCHIGLQVSIIALKIGDLFGTCSVTERLLRHIGFIGFQNLNALAVVEWLTPEVMVFATSLAVYIISKRLTRTSEIHVENGNSSHERPINRSIDENDAENASVEDVIDYEDNPNVTSDTADDSDSTEDEPNFDGLIKISPLFCLAALFFSAVLRPSVPGGAYFLSFLATGSYWATFQSLQKKFAVIIRSVMGLIVVHTICIVAYQTPWTHEHLDKQNLIARLIALEPLATSTCSNDIRIIVYDTSYKIDSFLNPIVLFLTYHILALTSKNLVKMQIVETPPTAVDQELDNNSSHKIQRQLSVITQATRNSKKDDNNTKTQRLNVTLRRDQQRPQNITEPTETTPLMHSAHHKHPHPAADMNRITSGSGTHATNDIPLNSLGRPGISTDDDAGILDQIAYGIMAVGGFIYQNSYIFTNVLMMAWSIIYHSWLTFVLLLWANALWMIPNQRKAMMRSSFFIVMYAELLLIAQYIYGMDLTNDELPSKTNQMGINLNQIGFDRPQEHGLQPCIPLIVKTSFVLMFWVTMRQFFKEKAQPGRRHSSIADIFAAVTAEDDDDDALDGKKTSKFLKKIGNVIKNLLVRLWIWLVILVIFLCGITGTKMTGFRICYMALFLFFLLVFQSSSKAWVRLMYGFWLFLIFYAMSILILIYTYQFDKFDIYWAQYLNVAKTLQDDIGLERYKTKDLLLHFIPPTLIVILTVIQVHYFHSRFIASMSQPPPDLNSRSSFMQHSRRTIRHSRQSEYEIKDFTESAGELMHLFLKRMRTNTEKCLRAFKGIIWSLLELHWIKVVYLTAFVCCVSEVSLLHVPFIMLCVFGTVSSVRMRVFFSRIISLVVTIIVLCKMIYQISYLNHEKYNTICIVDGKQTEFGNNAEWFGLFKVDPKSGLIVLLQKYIIYMVVATLHAVISLRQYQMRRLRGTQNDPLQKVPFPTINRDNAERNLGTMIKYLLNYGFYKFGYEICMIMLVTTITYRQDIVAVIYSLWLVTLLIFRRRKIAHFWGLFQIFLVIFIIVQYLVLVQVPPKMCMRYPWEDSPYSHSIQRWAMLPGTFNYDHTRKLIFDFVLLLMVNRQKRVYTIELLENFPGGSNESVMKDIQDLGKVEFINPTHDFLSHIRNYLDIFYHAILCGSYWATLAVVFLAGTSIPDFLALGYLIGAFMFLWEGSDFYLRPINQILTRWRVLIVYNVSNIVVKTCLQMAGCMFMSTLVNNCCWLVHVLGINCARSDPAENTDTEDVCPYVKVQVVLLWDSICFAFLIFQLRIFQSHYFCHIITDTRANNILASRGADIIEKLRQKKISKRQEYEVDILHKIKRKMEKIRSTQQKMLRPLEKPTHFDGMPTDSMLNSSNSYRSSKRGSGYHTPDGDAHNNNATKTTSMQDKCRIALDSKIECEVKPKMTLRLPLPEIEIETHTPQPATPSTDALTIPLEGFLEAPRLSCFSRTHSDLSQPKYNDSEEDETNEVFTMHIKPRRSPLLLCAKTLQDDVNNKSIASSMISSNATRDSISSIIRDQRRRQSSCNNAVSWNDTVSVKCSSNSPKPAILTTDEAQVTLSKCLHRRHQSLGNAKYSTEDNGTVRRRSSNLWWAQEEVLRRNARRPNSWGPVEHGNPVYSSRPQKRKEIKLHPHAVRAGDYYMFEDIDDKFELDLIADADDIFDQDNENITECEIKMNRRMTLYHVWKDISIEAYRREMNLMQRSYASAPLSNIDLLCDEHFIDADNDAGVGIRNSTLSEPLCYAQRSTSEYFDAPLRSKSQRDMYAYDTEPSTSKGEDAQAQKISGMGSETRHETLPAMFSEELEDKSSSETDLDANPIMRLIEGFLVTLTIKLNRLSRNYRKVNKILEEEKKTLKESSNLYMFYAGLKGRTAAAIYRLMKRNAESDVNEDDVVPPQPPPPPASSTSSKRNSANNAPPPSILIKQEQQQQQQQQVQVQQQPQQQLQQPSQLNHNNTYESMQSQSHDPQSPPFNTTISSSDPQQQQQQHPRGDINAIEPSSCDVADSTELQWNTNTKNFTGVRGRKSEPLPEIRIKAPSFERSHRGSGSLMSKRWSQDKVISSEFIFDEDDFTSRDHNVVIEVLISAWYALLSNTDIVCYIVAFIHQIKDASLLSLPLPLMIFFWGTLSLPRPSKTFWITLIAYTQASVLIKCIFQFKLIWTNYHYNLPNNPLGIEKLFGINMSNDYASSDLWLLLSLFFHRYILKSHGLWKVDTYKPIMHGLEQEEDKISINESAADQDVNAPEERRESGGFDNISRSEYHQNASEHNKLVIRVARFQRHKYWCGLSKFFHNLLHKPRLPADVYALMFLCDFVNFFVLLFGFTAFSSKLSDGGVKTYLAENKVPVPFLIMLLVQFLLIVIDRALYLRKALKMKIAFHFISVVGIHIWMFFIVPLVTERSFYASTPPIMFYFIKCCYLLLSSYQIKCGYPTRILGNFLTKSFSAFNMIAFKVYLVVPFLYELRTILDWLCTETTLTLFEWLKMEDIFANIYAIKCLRQMETDFPAVRGTKKATYTKILLGGAVILLIVFLIWGPLTLFALFNAVGQSNVPLEVQLALRIGSYEPIYVARTREATHVFDEEMFSQMKNAYIKEKEALSFLLNYHASDIAAIKLSGNSPTVWNIAPPDKERLLNELVENVTISVRLAYEITRTPPSKGNSGTVSSEITFMMNETFPYREALVGMINGSSTGSVIIPEIVPKFIKVLNSGDVINVHALFVDRSITFRDLAVNINSTELLQWWEIADYCNDDENTVLLKKLPLFNCSSGVVLYTFNDKKFPSTWTFITAGGIIGLYTTFVLVVSRFLKGSLGGQTLRIMYDDLPYVDRVLQLCLDIYLVREAQEFVLEEDLFAKLLFLYRSPETLIKWTRPPADHADDETDSESVRSKMSGRRSDQPQHQSSL